MIIPRSATLNETATSSKILNYLRQELGKEYQARVPMAGDDVQSIRAVGDIILGDEDLYNTFVPALINRIGRVVIQSKLYRNPLEQLKLGYMELGDVVEEIFVNLLKPHVFDPERAEQKWMQRELPNVDAVFHKINFKAFYKITISYQELRGAFLTWSGLHDLVGRIIEQAYTSANWDEYIMFKYLLASAAVKHMFYPVQIPTPDATNAKAVTTEMVAMSNSLQFMDGAYNAMGVPTYTDKENQIMLINTKFSAIQDVEVLAQAFNMDKAELQGRIIMVNDFVMSPLEMDRLRQLEAVIGTPYPQFSEEQLDMLRNIPAMLVDENFFMVIDQLFQLENAKNGEGLYWQYWLHTWKLFSWSPFANAIAFTTDVGSITSVTVSPTTATVAKGATTQLTATVVATGIAPTAGQWTLSGSKPVTSTISSGGLLSVAKDEENTSLTATFTSTFDSTKKASATITVGNSTGASTRTVQKNG